MEGWSDQPPPLLPFLPTRDQESFSDPRQEEPADIHEYFFLFIYFLLLRSADQRLEDPSAVKIKKIIQFVSFKIVYCSIDPPACYN